MLTGRNLPIQQKWLDKVGKGDVAVGHDPSQLHYSDLRALYLQDYAEQGHKSLRTKAETGVEYVDCLKHLDIFMGHAQDGDEGMKVSAIGPDTRDAFVAHRQADGAVNATINRSPAALRRMFTLAVERDTLKFAPKIKMLPEGEPRKGFWRYRTTTNFMRPWALKSWIRPRKLCRDRTPIFNHSDKSDFVPECDWVRSRICDGPG